LTTPLIEPLLGLRAALDRAIAAVQAVEPAVAAWEASGTRPADQAAAAVAPNGSGHLLGAPTGSEKPSRRRPGRPKLSDEEKRARRVAATREWRAKRKAEASAPAPEPELEPVPDEPPERPFRTPFNQPEDPEKARLLATAAALPWEQQP
jgi:hypothetical protein